MRLVCISKSNNEKENKRKWHLLFFLFFLWKECLVFLLYTYLNETNTDIHISLPCGLKKNYIHTVSENYKGILKQLNRQSKLNTAIFTTAVILIERLKYVIKTECAIKTNFNKRKLIIN